MPGQARKRSSEDESPVVEGEVTSETLDEMEQSAGREGEEPVIPVEMADDEDDDEDEDDADADDEGDEDEDEDEDEDDEEDEDEDADESGDVQEPEDR